MLLNIKATRKELRRSLQEYENLLAEREAKILNSTMDEQIQINDAVKLVFKRLTSLYTIIEIARADVEREYKQVEELKAEAEQIYRM